MPNSRDEIPDINQGLDDLTHEMTAGDLARKRGLNKKVKTISEKALKEWIANAIRRSLIGREDSFTDAQKEEMAREVQAKMEERLAQMQAQNKEIQERERRTHQQYEEAKLAAGENQKMQEVLANLQQQNAEAAAKYEAAEADLFDMQDRFDETKASLTTTIAEKDRLNADLNKLKETNRQLLMRSSALVESALTIDNDHYRGRHQETVDVSEDDDEFFRDFTIGVQVLESLNGDLERLHRTVSSKTHSGRHGIAAAGAEPGTADAASPHTIDDDLESIAQLGGSGNLDESHLVTLYEASDDAMAKLSGMVDVESEDLDDDDGVLIDDEPIAKLHRKIIMIGKGIGLQRDRLETLEEENTALRQQVGAQGEDDQQLGRQLAETLAAAAIPLDSESTDDTAEELRTKAAELEESLAADSPDATQINERGAAVIATMVAERKRIGDELAAARARAEAAETALRQLAGAAASAVAAEGEEGDDELGTAVANLRRDLDAPADLIPGGHPQLLRELSIDGAQVIGQLVEDRDHAAQRAERARAGEEAIAHSLLALADEHEDEAVQEARQALRDAIEAGPTDDEDPLPAASERLLAALLANPQASPQEIEVLQQQVHDATAQEQALRAELSEAQEALEAKQAEWDNLSDEHNEVASQLEALRQQVHSQGASEGTLREALTEAQEALAAKEEEVEILRTQQQAAAEQLESLNEQVLTLEAGQEALLEAQQALAAKDEELARVYEEHQDAAAQVEALNEQVRTLEASQENLAQALAELAEAQEEHSAAIAPEQSASLSSASHEVQQMIQRPHDQQQLAAAAQGLVSQLRGRNDELIRQLGHQHDELADLREQLKSMRRSTESSQQDYNELQKRNEALARDLATASGDNERLESLVKHLRQDVADATGVNSEQEQALAAAEQSLEEKRQQILELQAAQESFTEQLADAALTEEALNEELATLRERVAELESAAAELTEVRSAYTATGQQAEELRSRVAALDEQAKAEAERAANLSEQLEVLQAEQEVQAEAVSNAEQEAAELRSELGKLRTEYAQQDAITVALNERSEKTEEDLAKSRAEADQALKQLTEAENELDAARDRITELNETVQLYEKETAESNEQLQEFERKLNEAAETALVKEEEMVTLQARIDEMEGEVARLRGRAEEAERRVEALQQQQAELETLASRAPELETTNAKLAEEVSAARDSVSELEERLSEAVENLAVQDRITQHLQEQNDGWEDKFNKQVAASAAAQRLAEEAERAVAEERARCATLDEQVTALQDQTAEQGESLQAAEEALLTAQAERDAAAEQKDELERALAAAKSSEQELRQRLDQAAEQILEWEERCEQNEQRIATLGQSLEGKDDALAQAQATIAELRDLLRSARATIDEFQAREGQSAAGLAEEVEALREQLQAEEEAHAAARRLLADLQEGQDEATAGMRRRLQDAEERLGEADRHILELQSELDRTASSRVDVSELRSRIQDLEARNAELESLRSTWSGGQGRVQQLSEELESVQQQRDSLVARIRSVEGQLAEERGKSDGLKVARDRLRSDYDELDRTHKERLDQVRKQAALLRQEARTLREDNAGIRAKLRSLTGEDDDE